MATAMSTVRAAFLEAAGNAANLIDDGRVATNWERPSALEDMTVGAVAVHLASAVQIDAFLDAPEPPGSRALPPDRFFAGLATDLGDSIHRGVREGSLERAAIGPDALSSQLRADLDRLADRLTREPPDRRIRAILNLDMKLDGYLVTRVVELVVHSDDLAVSVEADSPALSDDLARLVIECLVGVARRRHGDLEVIRALTRHERGNKNVLKVF
jgi:uncharacterized protein (TIGR03083 family)